jgi:hypothetical protein
VPRAITLSLAADWGRRGSLGRERQSIHARDKLVGTLAVTGELLSGMLLEGECGTGQDAPDA